jgi:hypothetical protein
VQPQLFRKLLDQLILYYIPVSIIHEKFSLGLDAINIAPEFGVIETQTYLDEIKDEKIFNRFWEICYVSKKWEKWVNPGFDPYNNKEQLIKICGHYVLSYPEFLTNIKSYFPNIKNITPLLVKQVALQTWNTKTMKLQYLQVQLL